MNNIISMPDHHDHSFTLPFSQHRCKKYLKYIVKSEFVWGGDTEINGVQLSLTTQLQVTQCLTHFFLQNLLESHADVKFEFRYMPYSQISFCTNRNGFEDNDFAFIVFLLFGRFGLLKAVSSPSKAVWRLFLCV